MFEFDEYNNYDGEDYDYYEDDDYNNDDDVDMGEEDYSDDHDDCVDVTSVKMNNYTVLPEAEIRKRQEDEAKRLSSTLLVSEVVATKLLYHYNWSNVDSLHDDWFTNEEEVRAKVGLPSHNQQFYNSEELTLCGICFEYFPLDDCNFYPIVCGHIYCVTCWNGYITTSINDGPGCLSLRCPEPKCSASICRDMVDKLVGLEEKQKYDRYLLRSFVEVQKRVKWCPAPGCENAAEFELGSDEYDVTCPCNHVYCWNCVEESHRPADCDIVAKWILKNSSESENVTWILANSKPCPKCNRSIEKNHGCMHMTCTAPCRYEFCWLCLGDWKKHGESTGGFYACNIYETDKKQGLLSEEEKKREMAKRYMEKYTHYFERWAANDKSRIKASEDLAKMKMERIASKLMGTLDKPETKLEFIHEAWEQIIKCRRVLKWSYTYGYYMPSSEEYNRKRTLFEYLQGEAEAHLEMLHHCAEIELGKSFFEGDERWLQETRQSSHEPKEALVVVVVSDNAEDRDVKFEVYRRKLVNLTRSIGVFFENLVRCLENGMSECTAEQEAKCAKQEAIHNKKQNNDGINKSDYWSCTNCTFGNPNTLEDCEMCALPRLGDTGGDD